MLSRREGNSNQYLGVRPTACSLGTMFHLCQTPISTAQSSDILSLTLLRKVSCRTHSVIVYLLPVRVAIVQPQGDYYSIRDVMGFGSSAAWRSRRRHYRAAIARYRCVPFSLLSATEPNKA